MFVSVLMDANMAPNHQKELVGDPGFDKTEVTKNIYFRIQEVTKINIPAYDFSIGYRDMIAAKAKARMFAPFSESITAEPDGSAIAHPGMRGFEMPPPRLGFTGSMFQLSKLMAKSMTNFGHIDRAAVACVR